MDTTNPANAHTARAMSTESGPMRRVSVPRPMRVTLSSEYTIHATAMPPRAAHDQTIDDSNA